MNAQTRLSVVIVTHDCREAVGRTLPAVLAELADGDELIVVDNASGDGTAERVREMAPEATLIETGANLGYGGGNNRGAEAAAGELLLFLNPDAVPQAGFREAIVRPLADGHGWAAWQGVVTAEGGRVINTLGGDLHFTGIAWAGGAGEAFLPNGYAASPRESFAVMVAGEPGFVSGACLAIPRARFLELGGFPEEFFLYHEDVDISLRLRLAGGRLGVAPDAFVDHDYEFEKGPAKWRYLERNRWATLIRDYPAALLAVLAPALLATELALLVVSLLGGWLPQKLGAWADTLRSLPRLLRERRRIQRERAVGAARMAAAMTARLGSAYLGRAGRSTALNAVLGAYWSVVLWLLRADRSS